MYLLLSLQGGDAASDRGGSPDSDRRTIYSREKKSIFKKKKNSDLSVKSPEGSKLELSVPGKDDKKLSPKLSKKSFRKVAKIIKLGSGVKKSQKKSETRKSEEEDDTDPPEHSFESGNEEAFSPTQSHANETTSEQQDETERPQRPSDIELRQTSISESAPSTVSSTPSSSATSNSGSTSQIQRSSSSSSDDFVHIPLPPKVVASDESSKVCQTRIKTSQAQKSPTLPRVSEATEMPNPMSPAPTFSARSPSQATEGDEEFFSINEMHICICGQWLCVSNCGGMVMAFDFHLKSKKTPKVRIMEAQSHIVHCVHIYIGEIMYPNLVYVNVHKHNIDCGRIKLMCFGQSSFLQLC